MRTIFLTWITIENKEIIIIVFGAISFLDNAQKPKPWTSLSMNKSEAKANDYLQIKIDKFKGKRHKHYWYIKKKAFNLHEKYLNKTLQIDLGQIVTFFYNYELSKYLTSFKQNDYSKTRLTWSCNSSSCSWTQASIRMPQNWQSLFFASSLESGNSNL